LIIAELLDNLMRIAIDARTARVPTGLGRYVTNLVRAISQIDSENQYFVFAPKDARMRFDGVFDNGNFVFQSIENPIGDLIWEWLHFPRILRNRGIDLLHSAAFTFPTTISCASVVTIHDLFFLQFPEFYLEEEKEYLSKWTAVSAQRADAVICVSDAVRQNCLNTYSLKDEKVFAISEGADDRFNTTSNRDGELRLLNDTYGIAPPYVLHMGGFCGRKNAARLIGACSIGWQKEKWDHTLVIAGADDWTIGPALKRVAELGVGHRVKRLGYISDEHLPVIYRNADFLACVSLDEGFGLPAVEAMRCGVPVLASDRPCFHETCGLKGAVYVDPLNEESIWGGIGELFDDQLRKRLRQHGQTRGARYDWSTTAKRTHAIYGRVLGRFGKSRAVNHF
jgi:glycosyltransferase involved in cell wall biosynthesis